MVEQPGNMCMSWLFFAGFHDGAPVGCVGIVMVGVCVCVCVWWVVVLCWCRLVAMHWMGEYGCSEAASISPLDACPHTPTWHNHALHKHIPKHNAQTQCTLPHPLRNYTQAWRMMVHVIQQSLTCPLHRRGPGQAMLSSQHHSRSIQQCHPCPRPMELLEVGHRVLQALLRLACSSPSPRRQSGPLWCVHQSVQWGRLCWRIVGLPLLRAPPARRAEDIWWIMEFVFLEFTMYNLDLEIIFQNLELTIYIVPIIPPNPISQHLELMCRTITCRP